jgi:hypothetical protein
LELVVTATTHYIKTQRERIDTFKDIVPEKTGRKVGSLQPDFGLDGYYGISLVYRPP